MTKIEKAIRSKIVLSTIDRILSSGISIWMFCKILSIPRITYYRWKEGLTPSYFYTLLFIKIAELVEEHHTKSDIIDILKALCKTPWYHEIKHFKGELGTKQDIENFL